MAIETDFLVLGSGIAGLQAARKLAKMGTVALVTKKDAAESNTNYAQGGIAAVISPEDSLDAHVDDTLEAGAGLCDAEAVRFTVERGPGRIQELIDLGVRFASREERFDLGMEGGHSRRRILHAGDTTGREIERALLAAVREDPRIRLFERHIGVDLITESHNAAIDASDLHPGELRRRDDTPAAQNRCWGAYCFNQDRGAVETFIAKATVIATGGAGKVYLYTSNPDIASGDGLAMAYRAGARLANLEFVQFHPTCLFHPHAKSFLISEVLRGEGGRLVDAKGKPFMEKYSPKRELAPRDVVARAIDSEMKKTGAECVYLDMSHLEASFLTRRFPNIYSTCLHFGIDLTKHPIPVVPAAHYFCGGVHTDLQGATNLPGLFAIGEAAHTGLHGANRLASNSLLEGAVFAHAVAETLDRDRSRWEGLAPPKIHPWYPGTTTLSDEAVVIAQNWDEVRRLMWNYVGIVRSDRRLDRALRRMNLLNQEIQDYYWDFELSRDLLELRNIALIADLIIRSARRRKESRGLHFNLDHPEAAADAAPSFIDRFDPEEETAWTASAS